MDTTWTKYAKILKSGDRVVCFNVSQGSTASFSLEEFPNLVPGLMAQNPLKGYKMYLEDHFFNAKGMG